MTIDEKLEHIANIREGRVYLRGFTKKRTDINYASGGVVRYVPDWYINENGPTGYKVGGKILSEYVNKPLSKEELFSRVTGVALPGKPSFLQSIFSGVSGTLTKALGFKPPAPRPLLAEPVPIPGSLSGRSPRTPRSPASISPAASPAASPAVSAADLSAAIAILRTPTRPTRDTVGDPTLPGLEAPEAPEDDGTEPVDGEISQADETMPVLPAEVPVPVAESTPNATPEPVKKPKKVFRRTEDIPEEDLPGSLEIEVTNEKGELVYETVKKPTNIKDLNAYVEYGMQYLDVELSKLDRGKPADIEAFAKQEGIDLNERDSAASKKNAMKDYLILNTAKKMGLKPVRFRDFRTYLSTKGDMRLPLAPDSEDKLTAGLEIIGKFGKEDLMSYAQIHDIGGRSKFKDNVRKLHDLVADHYIDYNILHHFTENEKKRVRIEKLKSQYLSSQ